MAVCAMALAGAVVVGGVRVVVISLRRVWYILLRLLRRIHGLHARDGLIQTVPASRAPRNACEHDTLVWRITTRGLSTCGALGSSPGVA